MTAKTPTGLSVGIKQRLIQQALERRRSEVGDAAGGAAHRSNSVISGT